VKGGKWRRRRVWKRENWE